jgi:2-succinyl-5-enolpyruvyl-6-hydroxy-3-cyclohexene-1-carboxylate synthase
MTPAELNLAWSRALVDALLRGGVRHACVSPGSRSSPLALAIAERPELSTSIHIDERSGAFFGLGHARASGRPALLVCTSGTAGANYYPAVIEASQSRVPLIVLTADRPPELRETGAWQTIDQARLFGGFARWFVDVPPPADEPFMWRTLRSIAARAVAVAHGPPAGPVHLNLPFREPLVPAMLGDFMPSSAIPSPIDVSPPSIAADPAVIEDLAARIAAEPRGLILAGPIDPPAGYAEAVTRLASACGYPILAEPIGGLRYGPQPRLQIVTGHAALLRVPGWAEAHPPRLVLRFGASLTWKHVAEYLGRHPDTQQVVIDPERTWDDPTRRATLWIQADPAAFAERLGGRLRFANAGPEAEQRHMARDLAARAWSREWRAADTTVRDLTRACIDSAGADTVAWVYPLLLAHLPDDALLYAANSMAVRDLDTFTGPAKQRIRAIANRGAAGIDGTISSALGAAFGSGKPAMLVTGDLAFLHDLNGMGAVIGASPAARADGVDLTIVVLNDDGGGIFAHLPIASHATATFERFFRTPTGADLAAACATWGVPHTRARGPAELAAALGDIGSRSGLRVIEIPIDIEANTALHRRLWESVGEAVGG